MSGIALISGVHLRTRRDFDSLGPRLGLRYPRGFAVHVARPTRSIEIRSLPALARCYPRSFTFYVAKPIRSILLFTFPGTSLPQQEDISIGGLAVLLRPSRADTVAGVIVHAQENGLARSAGRLQARGHLSDMEWGNAWISDTGS